MDDVKIENPNSSNGDAEAEVTVQETDDVDTLKSELQRISDTNRQLFARAKKAEGFEIDSEGKWVKTVIKEVKSEPKAKSSKKSDELDYTQIAYHNTKSNVLKVESTEDEDFVRSQIEESGKSTKEVLNSKWFNVLFKEHKETQAVNNAVPQGAGNRNNQVPASKSIDYWLSKGDFDLPEDKPENRDLIQKVIRARYDRKKEGL